MEIDEYSWTQRQYAGQKLLLQFEAREAENFSDYCEVIEKKINRETKYTLWLQSTKACNVYNDNLSINCVPEQNIQSKYFWYFTCVWWQYMLLGRSNCNCQFKIAPAWLDRNGFRVILVLEKDVTTDKWRVSCVLWLL